MNRPKHRGGDSFGVTLVVLVAVMLVAMVIALALLSLMGADLNLPQITWERGA